MASTDEPTVFIVDDDLAVRDSLTILLQIEKIRTEAYAAPAEFLAGYKPSTPGCLVLDARLPGMNGVDLLDRLANEKIELPAIMITGHGDSEMIEAAGRRGVLKFFEKPFRSEELLASIRQAMSQD